MSCENSLKKYTAVQSRGGCRLFLKGGGLRTLKKERIDVWSTAKSSPGSGGPPGSFWKICFCSAVLSVFFFLHHEYWVIFSQKNWEEPTFQNIWWTGQLTTKATPPADWTTNHRLIPSDVRHAYKINVHLTRNRRSCFCWNSKGEPPPPPRPRPPLDPPLQSTPPPPPAS